MKDAKPVVVPTVLTAKASADLAKEIEKDLDISDPEEEVAKAALEDASEDTNNNGGDSNGPEGKDN